jgi:hypothetical protein
VASCSHFGREGRGPSARGRQHLARNGQAQQSPSAVYLAPWPVEAGGRVCPGMEPAPCDIGGACWADGKHRGGIAGPASLWLVKLAAFPCSEWRRPTTVGGGMHSFVPLGAPQRGRSRWPCFLFSLLCRVHWTAPVITTWPNAEGLIWRPWLPFACASMAAEEARP